MNLVNPLQKNICFLQHVSQSVNDACMFTNFFLVLSTAQNNQCHLAIVSWLQHITGTANLATVSKFHYTCRWVPFRCPIHYKSRSQFCCHTMTNAFLPLQRHTRTGSASCSVAMVLLSYCCCLSQSLQCFLEENVTVQGLTMDDPALAQSQVSHLINS